MGVVNNAIIRARLFRRRYKLALTIFIAIGLVFLVFSTSSVIDDQPLKVANGDHKDNAINTGNTDNNMGNNVVNNVAIGGPESDIKHQQGIQAFLSRLWKKKTIPFAETGAAQMLDFHSIMKRISTLPLGVMTDTTKLKLIAELHRRIDPDNKRLNRAHKYYDSVFEVLTSGKPKTVNALERYKSSNRIYHARYEHTPDELDQFMFSEKYLSQFLQLSKQELEAMTKSHQYVVDNLQENAPDGLYKGNGIVYVGGGKFNWLTLLSIKLIRAIGSELPIEVLIPELDEYEPDLCIRVFPALNARCIYLPHVLSGPSSPTSKIKFKGYQYKALAMMLLSFENILLLDSDNIPVHRPDSLFTLEPFVSKGLIVWPDFWRRATSPDYYKIAGIELDTKHLLPRYNEKTGEYESVPIDTEISDIEDIPMHQRTGAIPDPTLELGQLMISKKTHMKALLLALYYNMYGPSHYYPLFSQGSDGEGDKETFLAATVALKQPFYQVAKFLNAFGYFNTKHEFVGTGMGQYDPIEDWVITAGRQLKASGQSIEKLKKLSGGKNVEEIIENGPRILFVHANFPKLNPWLLKIEGKITDENNNRIRLYGTGMKKRTGYDFETVQYSNMKFLLCESNIGLAAYENVNRTELCEEIDDHLAFLKSSIYTLE